MLLHVMAVHKIDNKPSLSDDQLIGSYIYHVPCTLSVHLSPL